METTQVRIDWMNNAKGHWDGRQEEILGVMSRMVWDYDYKGKAIAMMPALGIQSAIKEFCIPKVDAVSYSCMEMAPYGFYGVSGHYKNADVKIYILDEGSFLTPVCAEVTEK